MDQSVMIKPALTVKYGCATHIKHYLPIQLQELPKLLEDAVVAERELLGGKVIKVEFTLI